MQLALLSTLLLASTTTLVKCAAAPEHIFVADYSGKLHTVEFIANDTASNAEAKLRLLKTTTACGTRPSWLFKGPNRERLWCVDDGNGTMGSVTRFGIAPDGILAEVKGGFTVYESPVKAAFAFNNSGVFITAYGRMNGSELDTAGGVTFAPATNGEVIGDQKRYPLGGLSVGRQALQKMPRAYGVATDPSEKFVVVPDLFNDALNVYQLNGAKAADLSARADLTVLLPLGTGPRHATFFRHTLSKDTVPQWYLFVVNELKNTIMTFNVSYNNANGTVNLNLTGPTREISTLADNIGLGLSNMTDVIQNTKAAEIKISPDNRFLTVSNTNVTAPGFQGFVDSLVTFSINADGSLQPVDYRGMGFAGPRGFEFHPSGDKLLAASMVNSTIAVYARDVESGKIGEILAALPFNTTMPDGSVAGIPHAIWDYR